MYGHLESGFRIKVNRMILRFGYLFGISLGSFYLIFIGLAVTIIEDLSTLSLLFPPPNYYAGDALSYLEWL